MSAIAPPTPTVERRPKTCQRGHPLVWVLEPHHEFAENEALAACECSFRKHDGRTMRGASTPTLWRWIPSRPWELRPVFLSQNRLAFAVALQMARTVADRETITSTLGDTLHKAKHVARLARRAQGALARLEAADLQVRGPGGA